MNNLLFFVGETISIYKKVNIVFVKIENICDIMII